MIDRKIIINYYQTRLRVQLVYVSNSEKIIFRGSGWIIVQNQRTDMKK